MRLAALFSGGKDSTYAAHLEAVAGHDIEYLVTVKSKRDDSYMFHTVNIDLASKVAEAIGIQSIVVNTKGEKEEELDDLENAIRELEIDGIVTGAISSKYQKTRVDMICEDLNIEHLSPLWGRNSGVLLKEMIDAGMEIIITAVAALGLDEKWLGRIIDKEAVKNLIILNKKYGVDICGEGGEMETLVINAPWFKERLEILKVKTNFDGVRGIYIIEDFNLKKKL